MFLRAWELRMDVLKSSAMKALAGLGLAALASQAAVAAPPDITGGPIPISIREAPTISTTVNLRHLGAITGSAPLIVSNATFLVNGQQAGGIVAELVEGNPGSVCVTISNFDYGPQPNDTYSLVLTITNLLGQTVGPVAVQIADTPGPTIELEGENRATCNDPNTAPVANAGGTRTIADTDGQDGEAVLLDGSASSDADIGTILTYQWFRGQATLGSPSTSPTLNVTLPNGVNDISLTVTDDSGDLNGIASANIQITVAAPEELTANAGPDQVVNDTDGFAGEAVTLDASASTGNILGYEWFLNDQSLGRTQILTTQLPDGVNVVTLIVTSTNGESTIAAQDTVQVTVNAAAALVANAGPDQIVNDTNGAAGETVTLDASASTGNILGYEWFLNDQSLGTTQILTTQLPDGVNVVTLIVTSTNGESEITAEDTVQVTVNTFAAPPPVANAGADQTVNDTDGIAGESVTLNASGSTGTITGYQWLLGDQVLGTTAILTARLPDGVNVVTLVVTSNDGEVSTSDSDTVQVTVSAAAAPVANAGPDQTVADSDEQSGESVTLDGSASTIAVGTISSYNWYLEAGDESRELLGSGVTITVQLPDGTNNVTLEVTSIGQLTSSDSVVITVTAAPEATVLSELPNLTPNQQRMAKALDSLCGQVLADDDDGEAPAAQSKPAVATSGKARAFVSEEDQADLVTKCRGLLFNNTAANQSDALDELNGDDFAAARTQTLLFANFQYAGALDRLMALRGGASGLSLAGLNIMVDGKMVPLATLQKMATDLLGGGASSDADEPGGLLSDKWGLWMRGNYSSGKKDASASSPSFDADQFALMGGLDYRLSDKAVIGGSLSYGDSSVEFNPSNEGGLDTTSWAVSAYGSMYAAKNFYFDAVLNVANSNYEADRNITYVDGQGLVNEAARGDTDGMTLSGGISAGYDFLVGGLTVSPNLGFFYIDATIDSFAEQGAGGLNLIYDEQNFKSLAGNFGMRVTYAWNKSWGVLLPHLRVDYVREFEDDVDVFGVRFAADPNAGSAPPILVETENPDTSYWRLAGGLSAQFKFGFSGYVEYQRLQSFEFITFQDVSVGLRMQKSF